MWHHPEEGQDSKTEKASHGLKLVLIYLKKCTIFGHFEPCRPVILEPVDVGNSYIPQKKAFLPIVLKKI